MATGNETVFLTSSPSEPEDSRSGEGPSHRLERATDTVLRGPPASRLPRRVSLFGFVAGIGFTGALVWYDLIPLLRRWWGDVEIPIENTAYVPAMIVAVIASFGICVYARRAEISPARAVTLGFVVELLAALSISVPLGPVEAIDPTQPVYGIPWVCVLIVIFPMLVPASPRLHGWMAVVCASMWTVSELVRVSFGWTHMPRTMFVQYTFASYLCAALSAITATLTHRLELDIERARKQARDLGSYRLERLLGRGGMGEVWLGRHRMLARPAAIKLIPTESLDRSAADVERTLTRFEREARATASLRSQHTVELYDFGRTVDGSFYYAMEYLEGIDLEQLVERYGLQRPGRVAHILEHACLSLIEAHGHGLIHRDIKPANLYLCRLGPELDVVKVLDFGLVREASRAGATAGAEAEASILGTPACMAPEASQRPKSVDARTDLYALGCVGYWLLTGRHVFDESTASGMIRAHVELTPVPPGERADIEVPAILETLVMRCLDKTPEARPPSASALREELRRIAEINDWGETERRAWWREFDHAGPDSESPTKTVEDR